MIVYSATKEEFSSDILNNQIVEKIQSCLKRNVGFHVAESEQRAFRNSLRYMDKVLEDPVIPNSSGISIEYQIPQTSKRIDFIISGKNETMNSVAVLIELKQWEEAWLSQKDGVVSTIINRGKKEVSHPSYQAWSYAALLEDFNETVRNDNVLLKPCAYLHNYESDNIIANRFYSEHIEKAPVFFKSDAVKLREFIKQFVKHGDSGEVMYRIDHGRIRPSKSLADKLASLLQGNQEFIMIDDQKIVYETALALAEKAGVRSKQVLIVEGGPGTGKSVVAVNLLVALINKQLNVQYVTKNAAPRNVYESKLTGSMKKTRISNLFSGSGAYTECAPNTFDVLIVDEAHRLNEKSGMFQNKGENQVKEIIKSAKLSVFFIDEDQKVTFKDIGEKEEIKKWAKKFNADIQCLELGSQFRCNGSDGYLAWLDNTLQIRDTANTVFDSTDYDFRVVDSPQVLKELIFEKNNINNKARLVAGYCWDWVSKNNPNLNDINIPEHDFSMRWNLASDGNLWIIQPESVNEIGCIHTCQGLELDYIGVIVGPDLICKNEKIITDPAKRSRMDSSIKGYRTLRQLNPRDAQAKVDAIIKNTYRTLMTRGMKGCYIYCVDKKLAEFIKSRIREGVGVDKKPLYFSEIVSPEEEKRLIIEDQVEKEQQFKKYLPVYSLEAACGGFGEGKDVELEGWVKIDNLKLSKNMFVSQVKGKSMEPKIADKSYCIFRTPVVGSRNNKIVLVQHKNINDLENGGQYTVKKYTSKKKFASDGTWEHEEIILLPLNEDYPPIVIPDAEEGEFIVVAEFVEVVG